MRASSAAFVWPIILSKEKAALAVLLLLGFSLRGAFAFSQINVFHPDELFQYLEQGHRLVFGSGVVPWEYEYGIRSWLLPSLIAAVMKACGWFSANPLLYIYALRGIAVLCSLSLIVVGFKMALSRAGLLWAVITGLFCATWYHAIFLSPAIMTEVLAAYLMFPAIYLASETGTPTRRTSVALGFLLGLAFCLRFQTAPALFVIACWHCRADIRDRWVPLALGALPPVIAIAGALDYVTLGTPFQSIWKNFQVNAVESVSESFGRSPWYRYLAYLVPPSGAVVLLPLVWMAIVGAYRAPLLAVVSLTVLISHSILPHKEYRFIAFTLLSLPILIGLGVATLADLSRRRLPNVALAISALLTALVPTVSLAEWSSIPLQSLPASGNLRAFLAAHDRLDLCGLAVTDFAWSRTGAYTFLHRDVPIFYTQDSWARINPIFLSLHSSADDRGVHEALRRKIFAFYDNVPLPMDVVWKGNFVRQFSRAQLSDHESEFNYLVARDGAKLPGYSTVQCFANEPNSYLSTACLLRRSGGCVEQ